MSQSSHRCNHLEALCGIRNKQKKSPIRTSKLLLDSARGNYGALFLGLRDRIGRLSEGKQADMFVVRGNPAVNMKDIRHTEIVFKDGVGYDFTAILKTIIGQVGRQ